MNLLSLYQKMRQNPMSLLQSRYQIPQGMNDPNEIIQHLLNSGQVSQAQVNQAMNMRSNPMVQQLMNMK